MSEDAVLLDVEDGIATITLNTPNSRNALGREVSTGIVEAIDEIERSREARVVVVRGAEGTFCAGGDINAMMELMADTAPLHEAVRIVHMETSRAVQRLYECYLPTVALIEGPAFGAGGNLALACDIQLAAPDARISFGFRQVGLAIDSGTSFLLPRYVGLNKAKELVFTGEMLDAEAALEWGLVNHVFEDFEAESAAFVESLAEGPTVALETSKRALNQGLDSTIGQAMSREAAHQAAVFETDDHREGVESFMMKRSPEFSGE